MEYMPSPESFCTPDFKSTFNPSPSSLYMYDQDHQDASRTLFTPVCTSSRELTPLPVAGEAEFDPLHPQFENSNNLEGFFGGVLGAGIAASSTHSGSSGAFERGPLKQELATIFQQDLDKLQPEVTEMNVDPYLFEDSDSMALRLSQGGRLQPASVSLHQKMVVDAEKETSTQIHPELGPKTFTPLKTVRTNQSPTAIVRMLQHQSQSSPSHTSTAASLTTLLTTSRTHNVTAVSPIPTTASMIKTEPAETGDSTPIDSNPCLHKILTSPSQQSPSPPVRSPTTQPPSLGSGGLVPSAAGQSRPPTLGRQGKSGSVEEKWREIEKFIHDPSTDQPQSVSAALDRKRKRHGSGGSTAMSDDESVTSQRMGSITDDDSDSDDDSDVSDTPFEESLTELAKKSKQYFWQYNIQAKGPKGTRLHLSVNDDDPHHPSHFEDPVFDPTNTSLVGIRHAGKARKGDGNEITPNPRKLYMIGQKLCRLNREINSVQLAGSLSASERSKSRKEKNKLSSRACRLKKKAQHEANKIKLFGLNCEQGELLDVVRVIWPKLREQAKQQMKENIPFTSNTLTLQINGIIKTHHKTKTAGNTADYVNQVVARVEDGEPTGGLAIKLKPMKVK